jgi:hypothetical protein
VAGQASLGVVGCGRVGIVLVWQVGSGELRRVLSGSGLVRQVRFGRFVLVR